jgi:hypothetical protein
LSTASSSPAAALSFNSDCARNARLTYNLSESHRSLGDIVDPLKIIKDGSRPTTSTLVSELLIPFNRGTLDNLNDFNVTYVENASTSDQLLKLYRRNNNK